MREEYIKVEQFTSLLSEIDQKLKAGNIEECSDMLGQMLSDAQAGDSYIDRTYIGNLNEKKRHTKIENINRMLGEMTLEQIDNVYKYTSDEYDEPNHEAEALDAIIKLSRMKKPEVRE